MSKDTERRGMECRQILWYTFATWYYRLAFTVTYEHYVRLFPPYFQDIFFIPVILHAKKKTIKNLKLYLFDHLNTQSKQQFDKCFQATKISTTRKWEDQCYN